MLDALFSNRSYQTLRAAFGYEERRAVVIAHNLANVETPGYKRHVPESFESHLKRVHGGKGVSRLSNSYGIESVEYIGEPKVATAQSGRGLKEVEWVQDGQTEARADGNNVEPTMEIADLADAELRYTALGQLLGQRYSGIKLVLTDGRR